MKTKLILLVLLFVFNLSFSQKIDVPKNIVYNYCDVETIDKTKELIKECLSDSTNYSIIQDNLVIGIVLWNHFKEIETIQKIEKKKMVFHLDGSEYEGAMSQQIKGSKIVWDELRKEITSDYTIRKANTNELNYYWSVISFDIDEPLLVLETETHTYILDFLKNDSKLFWIDEYPKNYGNTSYKNGEKVFINEKGEKETKLEQVVFVSSDKDIKKNSSVDDISEIIKKTNAIFEELFKDSKSSGKIMVQFELRNDENIIIFAVKDDLDLDIMKEFEKRINNETYPKSKKKPISLQLIYKVNSYNDTE